MAERRFQRHPARLEAAHGGKFLQARQQAATPCCEDRAGAGAVRLRKLCGHAKLPRPAPPTGPVHNDCATIGAPCLCPSCDGPIMVTPTRPATLTPLPHRSSLAAIGETWTPGGRQMPSVRHCRHCLGDCPGDCLLPGDTGLCIHQPVPGLSWPDRLRLLASRRWWRRVFWGVRR